MNLDDNTPDHAITLPRKQTQEGAYQSVLKCRNSRSSCGFFCLPAHKVNQSNAKTIQADDRKR